MKVDYRMQYYDVITNTRWRAAADMKKMKISMSANLSEY